ncbi:unnamed protein product [Spirodela intermedia]|uniref:DUF7086 domain-containing protein n=1 Tax=Spirodela intermedia TaxID=51605 RepID=A0A7I8K7L9_SPIIN|nr:unnamed protein product [Spirodela intermedia]
MDNGSEGPRKKKRKEKDDDELALSLSPPCRKPTTQDRNSLVVTFSSSSPRPPSSSEPLIHNQNPPSQETLTLTVSPTPQQAMALPYDRPSSFPAPSPIPPHQRHHIYTPPIGALPSSQRPHQGVPRARKNPHQGPRKGKDETVEPPFPWATDRRAVVHRKDYILSLGIRTITGEVKCKRCENRFFMAYDLAVKFQEVTNLIEREKPQMHHRARPEWLAPTFSDCPTCCHANCLKPVIATKKRAINWLFLLLGGTLCCCTIEQLKYFCKHTGNHRTGAKDRLLYLVYLGICKQLDPQDLFEFDR